MFTYKSGEKIIIGRKQSCDIHFDIEDNQLSRIQCTIECVDGNWVIKDSDGTK